jgi:hypothetical protein
MYGTKNIFVLKQKRKKEGHTRRISGRIAEFCRDLFFGKIFCLEKKEKKEGHTRRISGRIAGSCRDFCASGTTCLF